MVMTHEVEMTDSLEGYKRPQNNNTRETRTVQTEQAIGIQKRLGWFVKQYHGESWVLRAAMKNENE